MAKKNEKPRRRKGKPLSEKLAEKDRARAEADELEDEDDELEDADDEDLDEDFEEDDDDDDVVDAGYEDDDDEVIDAGYEDDEGDEGDEDDEDDEDDEGDEDEDGYGYAAAQMGHQRYVIAGFFGLWLIVGYILGRAVEGGWSELATRQWALEKLPQLASVEDEGELISRTSVSLLLGLFLGGIGVYRYYVKPEVRTWADEVAEQLAKVKWPTRKEVGNNTVVVIVCTAVITLYLTLLDRFWGFVTNLIYSGA